MEERKDICEGYERDSVQQLDKLAKDKNERFPIYPLTYIQAVYDARTKERLDSILWKCNNVYLPWMGSAGDTRVQLPFWMRRKGIIITYKNLEDETITEKLSYDLCIADDFFRLDSSWTRITDALPVGGNITIGSNGNWFQDGVDTGFKAQGPKGDNGLTPMLRTVNNKLQYSYDGEVWNEISEYIAAWFRFQDNKIQISRDQKTWSDLSKPFTQDLYIKGYVATSSALPSTGVKQGDIYMVGPTYAAEDTEHKNPIYRMYVYNDSGWVDNGVFQSIAAGVVQTIGNSETEVMSQKAVSSIVGLDTYPVFSDTKPYVKGEIVNYGGLLYEFTVDHEAGAWIGTDARETSLIEMSGTTQEQQKEYIYSIIDSNGKLLFGIKSDDGHPIILNRDLIKDIDKIISMIDDTNKSYPVQWDYDIREFLQVELDDKYKILGATFPDGSHYLYNLKSETILEEIDKKEDFENRLEITLDNDGKILSYRDKDGVKHERGLEVETLSVSNIELEGNSVNDIKKYLLDIGFDVKTPIDWSDSSFIQIPEPRFAIINITGIDSMPTQKGQDLNAWLEFWDMQGNYFKKRVVANAQGNSSMQFIKKNASFDFCDDEWIGDDTPNIRFGTWVPQDSFHMKAYYTDFFRGVCPVCYKLYDQIVKSRGNTSDRPWKKALIDMSKIKATATSLGNPIVDDYSLQTDTGARCFPDGFPVACYLNGTFYGIFSWQLKKSRENYHLDKNNAKNVHLDGLLNEKTLFGGRNNIKWEKFEVRNPKNLYTLQGKEYDADVKQEEIAGYDEINAWIETGSLPDGSIITSKIEQRLRITAEVKNYIYNFSDSIGVIKTAMEKYEQSGKTEDDLNTFKSVYEVYFDKDNIIDYMIVSDLIRNEDGFSSNWQWFTYDGIKWFVGLYDCDMAFGAHFSGTLIRDVLTNHISSSLYLPNGYVVKYYSDELNTRYANLADAGIATSKNIFGLLKDWTMRIGTSFFEKEYSKWPETPCISNSEVRIDYWEIVKDDNGNFEIGHEETFDATVSYAVGETVFFGLNEIMGYFKFKCIKNTIALPTNNPHTISTYSPIKTFKFCDNIYRVEKWIDKNLSNMDKIYKYK